MILFPYRKSSWSQETRPMLGRSILSTADDAHSFEDSWDAHLDTSNSLQEGKMLPGWLRIMVEVQYKGMAGNVLFTLLDLLTLSGLAGAHWDKANHTQFPHGFPTTYSWQFMNTTAYVNNKANCYVCAHIPLSIHSSGLWPYSITESKTVCLPHTQEWEVLGTLPTSQLPWTWMERLIHQ